MGWEGKGEVYLVVENHGPDPLVGGELDGAISKIEVLGCKITLP